MTFSFLPRHVPPTATPLTVADWGKGFGAFGAQGRANADFAAALRAYLGVPHLFLASSGRTALRLLLDTLRRQPHLAGRMEVTLPAYTCPAVAKVVLDAGLIPRLVDLDPLTFTYPPEALVASISEKTLAVMVVHPFGLPVAMEPALTAAQAVGAVVIEDAAQSMGARVNGRPVGTQGHVGLYSLGPGKPLALGGGGVLATADNALAAALTESWASLLTPEGAAAGWLWMRLGLFSMAFQPPLWWLATQLGAQRVGDNEANWGYQWSGLSAPQAAVGVALLPKLDAMNQKRRDYARQLMAALNATLNATLNNVEALSFPGVIDLKTANLEAAGDVVEPVYLRLPMLTENSAQADAIFKTLTSAGIGVGRMYRRTLLEIFPQLASESSSSSFAGSERVARTLLTLPTNHHLTQADLMKIPQLVGKGLKLVHF
jgi:perosamine synthetase